MNKKVRQPAVAPKARTPQPSRVKIHFPVAVSLLVAAVVLFVRVRLLSLPLERDEGEYAYMGQSILNGILPYSESYNMKLPGVYYMYALIMALFGQSPAGIHTGLLLLIAGSAVLLFFLGKRVLDTASGFLAAATYLVLTSVPGTYGFAAHAAHFIVFFALAGLLALLKSEDGYKIRWLIVSGFCFGLAFLMKQQAAVFLVMGGVLALFFEWQRHPRTLKQLLQNLGIFSFAAVSPYILIVLLALATGTFDKFWYWTVSYARQYVGINTWAKGISFFSGSLKLVTEGVEGFWIVGLLGIGALFLSPLARQNRWTILLFFLFSFLSICPGLYFRNHYFIAFLPALSLAVAAALRFPAEWENKFKGYGLVLSLLVFSALAAVNFTTHAGHYFNYPVSGVCARMYGRNPFQESVEVAKFIRKNTAPGDRIAILGSEPQIYFYSQRKAATGYLYAYPLMEIQPFARQMQQEMIDDIERNKPKYLVVVNSAISWLASPQSDVYIMNWYAAYSETNYHLVGFVDMISPVDARYVWGEAVQNYRPLGKENIAVMERNK